MEMYPSVRSLWEQTAHLYSWLRGTFATFQFYGLVSISQCICASELLVFVVLTGKPVTLGHCQIEVRQICFRQSLHCVSQPTIWQINKCICAWVLMKNMQSSFCFLYFGVHVFYWTVHMLAFDVNYTLVGRLRPRKSLWSSRLIGDCVLSRCGT